MFGPPSRHIFSLRMIARIVAGRGGYRRAVVSIHPFVHHIYKSRGKSPSPLRFTSPFQLSPKINYFSNKADHFRAKNAMAVDNYVNNLAEIFDVSKEHLKVIVAPLLFRLEKNEFWNMSKGIQRLRIVGATEALLHTRGICVESSNVFSCALDSLMLELHSVKSVSADSRIVPVDYHIADTDLKNKFDMHKFVAKLRSVANEWNATKGDSVNLKEKYIAPYFCFIQSSGMGKTKLMYEFAKLTKMTSTDAHEGKNNVSEDFTCDLILTNGGLLEKEFSDSGVFDIKLDLQSFVRDPHQDISTVARTVQDHLENVLVTNRPNLLSTKKIHVFLFDEAQVLLATHYQIDAFLFRCIRTWLRRKRNGKTMIAVFSGTSSSIMNYTIQTDLLTDGQLEQKHLPSCRDSKNSVTAYSGGSRTFEPFFTLTTMGVVKPTNDIPDQSDYDKSIRYGRPLFTKLHEKNELESNIQKVLRRLLLDTGKDGFDWREEKESWLSVLGTRVQMGSTNLYLVSDLVTRGYANLTGITSNGATFVYMPDPVCARLAICLMDENWRLESWHGKSKKWWAEAVKTLYSTGLCRPEKGNVGEILTALYFLFCCDECRQSIDGNSNYTTFSVPLEDWVDSLIDKRSSTGNAAEQKREAPLIRVNFIQVCRDYLRSPWIGLADQVFLENLYNAGTAFYTYPGCGLIDLVIPTVITAGNTKPTYSSVLVSIKSRKYFSPSDAKNLCNKMKSQADDSQLKSALCIVCVFGQSSVSKDREYKYDASILRKLAEGQNVAIVLRLPRNDRFGLSDIFHEMTTPTDSSELMSSHTFLRTRSQTLEAKEALKSFDDKNPPEVVKDYLEILKDMDEE